MVISRGAAGEIRIRTKSETVTADPRVTIGTYLLPGAGEYDIASIQAEGQLAGSTVAYFLRTEDLVVMVLDAVEMAAAKLDDAANSHVLILEVKSDDSGDTIRALLKAIEPSYVALIGAGATAELHASLGMPTAEAASLKVTRVGLPIEGTFLLPLA